MELSFIHEKIEHIEDKLIEIETKIDKIIECLEEKVNPNCEKMNQHINFIEKIYDNVKNPLGYFCNLINYHTTSDRIYSLES